MSIGGGGDFLSRELEATERALEDTERKLLLARDGCGGGVYGNGRGGGGGDDDYDEAAVRDATVGDLVKLEAATNHLLLVRDVSDWVRKCDDRRRQRRHDGSGASSSHLQLSSDCYECCSLARLLARHTPTCSSSDGTYLKLLRDEYLPLHDFVRSRLILDLRDGLRSNDVMYPSKDGCSEVLRQWVQREKHGQGGGGGGGGGGSAAAAALDRIASLCVWIVRVDAAHRNLANGLLRSGPAGGGGAAAAALVRENQQRRGGNGNNNGDGVDSVVLELCRPFVERVRYHFVAGDGEGAGASASTDPNRRFTTSRIDRLPEWLFGYLREQFFGGDDDGGGGGEGCSPWEFVVDGIVAAVASAAETDDGGDGAAAAVDVGQILQDQLPVRVLNEMVRIVQWVLNERNFFRHPKICGPDSNPLLLAGAIEQLLRMDRDLQDSLSMAVPSPSPGRRWWQQQRRRLLSLMDIFVAGDEELLQWWLERERETTFATMFGGDADGGGGTSSAALSAAAVVHPRAELFCALIRSIQCKTALFSFTGPYWNRVAAPFCVRFVDAIHDSVVELKLRLAPSSGGIRLRGVDAAAPASLPRSVVTEWMQWINGTHLAAQTLSLSGHDDGYLDGGGGITENDDPFSSDQQTTTLDSAANQDVLRFGRSLQNLEQVLIEDFSKTFVETLLLERAKMAGYLMRCSTLLLLEEKEDWMEEEEMPSNHHSMSTSLSFDDGPLGSTSHNLSPDLRDAARLLHRFLRICDNAAAALPIDDLRLASGDGSDDDYERLREMKEIAEFAPRVMRERVLVMLSDKLMEVAMNFHDMTPDLYYYGCTVFAEDVEAFFGSATDLPPYTLRLIEITTKLMALPSEELAQIGQALCGLAGLPAPLSESSFEDDDRLYGEAVSMIRAKGFVWVELQDVLSILNRRRELNTGL